MSVISRRQKEILLSDVQRMINNNNHTAFANHAKIAERITNGDLAFYIDSPKKEFVIKNNGQARGIILRLIKPPEERFM